MKIELLSPAKNIECGIEAINHGADAVYIGAPQFGARIAAGNSLEDIQTLIKYAHQYDAKVYITLNTILNDFELSLAEKLIRQLYNIGADAIIIQDMGILELHLPPIAIHASTQTDNRTVEKVKFLESVGISRVILARELPLPEIQNIRENTSIELEAFVHGALCVSYSGQCYISQASCGRSANKGNCAQYCRLSYDLLDSEGKTLVANKHLLSLKDMDRSDYLKEMIDAGISSFKIEGRLKDIDYVKNITAFYRQKLDGILENRLDLESSSSGKSIFYFTPDPQKTFSRGKTDYLLHGKKDDISSFQTSKSIGEFIGTISQVGRNYFYLNSDIELSNGDGICYFDDEGTKGFYINKIDDGRIYPSEMPDLKTGIKMYRNFNHQFNLLLQKKSAERKIDINIVFKDTDDGFCLEISDNSNHFLSLKENYQKELASKPEQVIDNIKKQLSKLGNTIYSAEEITVEISQPWFIPSSVLSSWRKEAIELFDAIRLEAFNKEKEDEEIIREARELIPTDYYKDKDISYLGNVMNEKAVNFYKKHGAKTIKPAFEILPNKNAVLMQCEHCIKYALGWCPKKETNEIPEFTEPLYLKHYDNIYRLEFDCEECKMYVF
ncbi:MAG: U32 family peptidase [Bacteroidales bacterium]|jgi:putative protease|nr:U32 family peptidase [Bacteroidales bacterium]